MKEIWADISGHNGYQVSNMGNVKNKRSGRILKQGDNGNGYKIVVLRGGKDEKPKMRYVHRLVAVAFCKREDGKNYVDHINCVRDDNVSSNLRWCTAKENCNFPQTRLNASKSLKIAMNRKDVKERLAKSMEKVRNNYDVRRKMSEASILNHKNGMYDHLRKAVLMIDMNGNIVKEYESLQAVLKEGYDSSFVSKACRGKKDAAYGYIWRFK